MLLGISLADKQLPRGTSVIQGASAVTFDLAAINTRLVPVMLGALRQRVPLVAALTAVSLAVCMFMPRGMTRSAVGDTYLLLVTLAAVAAFFF